MTTMTRTAWGLDTPTDDDWRLHAACRGHDPEMWSLSSGYNTTSATYKAAHRICAGCPVRAQCETYALETGSWGLIFGGRDFHKPERIAAPLYHDLCAVCGKAFQSNNAVRRWCGDHCRKRYFDGSNRRRRG